MKEYRATGPTRSTASLGLLTALLSHPTYRDSFLTPTSEADTLDDLHGPYVGSRLSASDYQPMAIADAVERVQSFVDRSDYPGPTADARRRVQALLDRLQSGNFTGYCLVTQGDDLEHDLSFIIDDFCEYVFVHVEEGRLLELVHFID